MKRIYKFSTLLILLVMASAVWISCSDDDSGTPFINYVRVTKPEASDSLLVSAGQGATIAIMGGNLKSVEEVWFNDRAAMLVPTFITDRTIIVRVPSMIPSEVTNTIRVIFANGKQLTHEFNVAINPPLVERLKSEYVNDGGEAVVYGDYFYAPVSVTFAGGVEGEILNFTDTEIRVKVPEGAEPGPITVTSNFGETDSDFWFRDNRNIFGSMDGTTQGWWHGADRIVASDPVIEPIANKFMRVNMSLGAGQWSEWYVGGQDGDIGVATRVIPDDAIVNPEDYYLKFEINTLATLSGQKIRLYIDNTMDNRNTENFAWMPNLHTNGEWQTVAIPFDNVISASRPVVSATGYAVSFWFWEGSVAGQGNFGIDNLRVVPRVNK